MRGRAAPIWPLLALLGAGIAAPAAAQVAEERLLLELPGRKVGIRYAPGSLARASAVQSRFEAFGAAFSEWSGEGRQLAVYLLGREDWEAAGIARSYGLPARVGADALALAAWGDEGTIALWRGLLRGALPAGPSMPLRGSPSEAASLVPLDALATTEAARILLEAAGYRGGAPWVTEVLAQTVTVSFLSRRDQERLPVLASIHRQMSEARPGALALADYRPGLADPERLWFESRFFDAARRLADAEGPGAAKAVLKLARKHGRVLPASALLLRYPEVESWLTGAFAAGR